MAISTKANFQIFHDQFFGGMQEVLTQNANVFNEASNGCIRLIADPHRGDFQEESFMSRTASLVTRRDITSVAAVTSLGNSQALERRVKLNQKIGPVEDTLDAWRKIGSDQEEMSLKLGEQTGVAAQVRNLNLAITAVEAAIDGQTDLEFTATGTLDYGELADGLQKLGDNAGNVRCWVMHSKVATDLLKQAISDKITDVANIAIINGSIFSLGRPIVVTDSSALIVAGSPNNFVTLGLVENGVIVRMSEEQEIATELVTGLENLTFRIQGEYAITVGCKGFRFATTVNPTDAQLATSSNWTKVAASHKSLAGIRILSQ